jgi:citrate lyase subunit beta/citryl-CoA lyase
VAAVPALARSGKGDQLITRTILFVPGNKQKMVTKSLDVGTDALVWDLEDAVPLAEKDLARTTLCTALTNLATTPKPIYVRINSLGTGMLQSDLTHVVHPGLYGVMLSKSESASQVKEVDQALTTLEAARGLAHGTIKIHCILETCLGVLNAYPIASSSSRVDGISFGAEDFTLDLGTARTRDGLELAFSRASVGLAAGAAKVMAIDTVYSDLNDEEGLARECRVARQLGYKGKFALHPKQIEIINREFSPSESELAYAEKVVGAFNKAQEANIGVITVDGKMIDPPVVERARQLLRLKRGN